MTSEVQSDSPGNNDPDPHYSRNEITIADASSLSRTVGGTAVGNFTEWFDFGVYSYLVATISQVFFPEESGIATIAAFAGLAVSFFIRPVGGIFWGMMGDRIGRKTVLALTVLLMAFGTFALGLVPGYASIGIWAPIILFVLRGIQGFSTGGEYVGAMTFLVEHSPDKKRGHLCSFLPLGTLTGYITGAFIVWAIQASISEQAMLSWGWRLPFLLAGPLGIIGLYVRMSLEETPAYEKEKEAGEAEDMAQKGNLQQLKETIVTQWRPILICMGLVLSFNVTNYMLTGYMPTFLPDYVDFDTSNALLIVTLVMVVLAVLVTFLGRLSDRVGRRPVMFTGALFLTLLSVPAFLLLFQAATIPVFLGVLFIGLMLICFQSTEPSTLPTLFPTHVRSGATAVAFNISVSAFGGTTPLIAEALVKGTGNIFMPAYILVFAGIVGLVSVYALAETARRPLKGSGPTVESEEEAEALAEDGLGAVAAAG